MPEVQALGVLQALSLQANPAVAGVSTGELPGTPAMFASLLQSLMGAADAGSGEAAGLPLAFLPPGKGGDAPGQLIAAAAKDMKGKGGHLPTPLLALRAMGISLPEGAVAHEALAGQAGGKMPQAMLPADAKQAVEADAGITAGVADPAVLSPGAPAAGQPVPPQVQALDPALAQMPAVGLPLVSQVAAQQSAQSQSRSQPQIPEGMRAVSALKGDVSQAKGVPGDGNGPAIAAGGRQELPVDGFRAVLAQADGQVLQETVQTQIPARMEGGVAAVVLPDNAASTAAGQMTLAAERSAEALRAAVPAKESSPMQLPLKAQGWDNELGQRVVWMVGRQSQTAELTVNPPNMGSIEVRLSLQGNEAGAQFFSAHPAVREAIEAALPRLREMLAESGFSLGDAQVSDGSFADERRDGGNGRGSMLADTRNGGDSADEPVRRAMRGMVDLYA